VACDSPELDPIENLWAIIKKVAKVRLYNQIKTERWYSIYRIWYHDKEPENLCSNLVDSLPSAHTCCYTYQCQRRTHKYY